MLFLPTGSLGSEPWKEDDFRESGELWVQILT